MLLGIFIGYFSGTKKSEAVAPCAPQKNSITETAPLQKDPECSENLRMLSERIEKLENQLQVKTFKAARYDKANALWMQYGFGTGGRPSVFEIDCLAFRSAVTEFFEWDAPTLTKIEQIRENTNQEIKEWEMELAVCTKATDRQRVYEIPQIPEEIGLRYKASLESVIGTEDLELLISEIDIELQSYTSKKIVTLSPESDKQTWQQLQPMDLIRYQVEGRISSGTGCCIYSPDNAAISRWSHLLGDVL